MGVKKSRKPKGPLDDTPRGFKKVIELQERMKNPKLPKRNSESRPPNSASNSSSAANETPKIERKKGESMSEFSRRVDQAIPLPRAKGVESRKTLRNSKKHKTKAENLRSEYHQRWEAKKRRMEDQDEDSLDVEDDGEDIWASVNARKKQPKFGEQADRPPELPTKRAGSSIPNNVGSLARRQMLEEERARFIEEYRKLKGPDIKID